MSNKPSVPSNAEINALCDRLRATLKKLAKSGSTIGIKYKVGVTDIRQLDNSIKHEPNGTMSMIIEINGGAQDFQASKLRNPGPGIL